MPKYNTLLDVAFTVEHDCEDPNDIPFELAIAALEKRLAALKSAGSFERCDAFGVNDTYAIMDKPSTHKTYRVILSREASESVMVTVDAETPEQANGMALAMAGSCGENISGWNLDDNQHQVYLPDPESTEEMK